MGMMGYHTESDLVKGYTAQKLLKKIQGKHWNERSLWELLK